ncbi:MAG: ChbG/HpnK family deacetylase [Armatimonadota bacterium]|nr:ChbG/HpnK family deacetylase [Armatimonadota bacterium]
MGLPPPRRRPQAAPGSAAAPVSVRVIVHADDFGLHPALNEGIERAHREGLVSSASLMPTGPAFDDAVRRSRALPQLDLGLHFALVGVPGCPPTLSHFALAFARGQMPTQTIAESLRSQLDAAFRQGVSISHIDSHQHLHTLPTIMRVVCAAAREYGIPAVRLPLDGPAFASLPPGRHGQAALLRVMARLSRRYITAFGLRTTDYFAGMAVSGHLTAWRLGMYLRQARPGTTEIVCHPGADNAVLGQAFAWGYDWEGELAAVCDPGVRLLAEERQIRLTGW